MEKREIARLEAENARLSRRLAQAEAIIRVQKKLSEALGLVSGTTSGSYE